MKKILIIYIFLCSFKNIFSQEIFSEMEVGKKFLKKQDAWINLDFNYKQDYRDFGWKRLGGNISYSKRYYNQWTLTAGNECYTILDKNAPNYFELRPYGLISLRSRITKNLYFAQFFKAEWRFMLYHTQEPNDHYQRLRYRFHLDWMVHNDTIRNKTFSIKPGIEWYILKNTSTGERYANSREYYLRFCLEKGEKEWNFGYKIETFFQTIHPNEANAHTLFFEYKF